MPCNDCKDPALCRDVCAEFVRQHTAPAGMLEDCLGIVAGEQAPPAPGDYERRVKELVPKVGMARAMARADMEAGTPSGPKRPYKAGTPRPAGCDCSGIGNGVSPSCPVHSDGVMASHDTKTESRDGN